MADRCARRGGVVRGRAGPRRSTQWLGSADDTTVTALAETSVTGDAGGLFERIEVDSKAMRKLKDDQTLLLVCEVGQTIDATGTFDVQAGMRYLFGS